MSRKRHRFSTATLVALALATCAAAVAWACTPSAYIGLSGTSFHPGSSVTVTGNGFIDAPVEIRWSGPGAGVLAVARGPSFSATFTVPSAPPGRYYVQATARDANGTTIGHASRPLQIPAPAPSPAAGGRLGTQAPAPARAPSLVVDGSRADRTSSPSRRAAPVSGGRSSAAPTALSPAARTASTPVASAREAAVTRPGRNAPAPGPRSASAPSSRSASGDLWSGFAARGHSPSLSAASGPAGDPGSELTAGLALLSLGILGLAGGIAAARRRRAAVRASR